MKNPQVRSPTPPFLAMCCHHQKRNKRSGEQLPMLLPLLLKEMWSSILPHHPEQGGRTLLYYLAQPL